MTVAFFLENKTLSSINFKNITEGNPGVGGSEYMTVLIATLLSKRENGIHVILYIETEGEFEQEVKTIKVKNLESCIIDCNKRKVKYLLFKHDLRHIHEGILNHSSYTGLIPWCHNFAPYSALNYYAKNRNIPRILCVGREQQDLYRDHIAFNKSDYIFNCVSEKEIEKVSVENYPFEKRENIVTYIGALGYQKGFHWLAEAWPIVLREIPDAKLYIIGSGALYSRDFQLGKWGIAEKSYEDLFMPYLTDGNNIHPSVHFMGIMGTEKNEILLKTKVGVPNPSGFSETFGISAVEMQSMGCKIATIKCAGYLDTVINGKLYNSKKELANTIIELLKSNDYSYGATKSHLIKKFSQESVIQEWEHFLLCSLPKNRPLHNISNLNMSFENKSIKEIVRKVKQYFPFLYYLLPSVELTFRVIDKIRGRKLCHPHRNIGA